MNSPFGKISEGPSPFKKFESNKYLQGSKEFLQSNSLVAKFAFLLLVIFLFVIALRIGTSIISFFMAPDPNPVLINGMIDGKQTMIIPSNPAMNSSKPILRSDNEYFGLEFTWSTWIYIDDFTHKEGKIKHIFHKGNTSSSAPGLYLAPNKNDLIINMDTFEGTENVLIDNIPMKKWVNVIIRVDKQHNMDVFINGTLTRRHILKGVPKQNYGDTSVALDGGFSGYISDLRYFNYALGTNHIQRIVDAGPNLKMIGEDIHSKPYYLSTRWYFAGTKDGYNP